MALLSGTVPPRGKAEQYTYPARAELVVKLQCIVSDVAVVVTMIERALITGAFSLKVGAADEGETDLFIEGD